MSLTVTYDRQKTAGHTSRLRNHFRSLREFAGGILCSAVAPHKASLSRLAEMPFTVLGFGSGDFAAFHLAHGWGWLVTGISLVVIEHMVADPE